MADPNHVESIQLPGDKYIDIRREHLHGRHVDQIYRARYRYSAEPLEYGIGRDVADAVVDLERTARDVALRPPRRAGTENL